MKVQLYKKMVRLALQVNSTMLLQKPEERLTETGIGIEREIEIELEDGLGTSVEFVPLDC